MTTTTAKMTILFAAAGLLATGCATTKVSSVSKAAPITYKIGKGDTQFASLTGRDSRLPSTRPNFQSQPLGGQGRTFDPSKIDRQLYSHQKVGKRYTIMGRSYTPRHDPDYDEVGTASWYGPKFHGKPTANGETFDKRAMTAAHKTLPLNSMVVVTNLENGRTLTLRLNDRGPFIGDRIIDLSEAAAEALGYKGNGLAQVRVQYAGPADPMAGNRVLPRQAPRVVELPRENLFEAPAPAPVPQPAPYDPCQTASASYKVPASCLTEPTQPFQSPYSAAPAAPIAPQQPRRAPNVAPPASGNVTMTIKGPIHSARSDDTQDDPEFIAERFETD